MLCIRDLKKVYKDKKVLITGHNGFKGSYLCVLLKYLGAKVYGYSLKPEKNSLYELLTSGRTECPPLHHTSRKIVGNDCYASSLAKQELGILSSRLKIDGECIGDIRDYKKLKNFVNKVKPDYIIHMAAQPLVIRGYEEPRYTYEVNVMGTTNLLDAIKEVYKNTKKPISILNVTTDKVYENNDHEDYAFKELDKLCGRDPYANSKSCSELVTYSYEKSFFYDKNKFRISTARAGNVIGGGDLNANRIIPDCYKAIRAHKPMEVRNPASIRPYQFVLEPLIIYLNIMALQLKDKKYEGHYNIGPDKKSCLHTKELVEKFFVKWNKSVGDDVSSSRKNCVVPVIYDKPKKTSKHEASFLRLDNNLIKKVFSYKEIFKMDDTMKYTTGIYKAMLEKKNIYAEIVKIINNL